MELMALACVEKKEEERVLIEERYQ